MKTVKEYLNELNTTRLVDTLFEEFGDKLFDLYYFNTPTDYHDEHIEYDETVRELTVMEYAQARRKELYDYIRYLKDLKIKEIPGGKTGVIYAFKRFEHDYFDRWQVRLLFLEELLDDPENCKNRIFTAPFKEVLGFRVADNEFTQEIIYQAIARVLNVVSFMGFRQENMESFLEEVKKNEGDFGLYMPIDERKRFDYCVEPENAHLGYGETLENREKLNEVWKAIYEYEMCSMRREREIILRSHGC